MGDNYYQLGAIAVNLFTAQRVLTKVLTPALGLHLRGIPVIEYLDVLLLCEQTFLTLDSSMSITLQTLNNFG